MSLAVTVQAVADLQKCVGCVSRIDVTSSDEDEAPVLARTTSVTSPLVPKRAGHVGCCKQPRLCAAGTSGRVQHVDALA